MNAAVTEAIAAKDGDIADLKDQLAKKNNSQLNELGQYSRRVCVNVSGIPETAGESTDQVTMDLGKMAGVTVLRTKLLCGRW